VQRLSGEQLKRLFSSMELIHLNEEEKVIAQEGSPDAFLLLIVSGVVEAFLVEDKRNVTLRTFTSGDIIGEAALLERSTWPASYRVSEPVIALRLSREGLEKTLVGNPDPRGFLEALREQHNDRDVAGTLRRLRGA
jgi:CRP-like cAMP-binding protein